MIIHSALKLAFWLCFMALLHSYLFYPLLLRLIGTGKKNNRNVFARSEPLPFVSILIAAYNEEEVIAEKIESIFRSGYPSEKMEVIVGSDHSTDHTDEIIRHCMEKYPRLHLEVFTQRTGKVMIINSLYKKAAGELLIITDANVIFDENTIYELVKHFKENSVALVDSNMINKGLKKEGISVQEKTYIQAEVFIKNAEGRIWGSMMGPFGGCYAIRKSFFTEVPANFLVDDFYINMKVLEKGGRCINETTARVYEDVSNNLGEEFRRKVRIATGNFQNLFSFSHLLWRFDGISFSFFSHKVLRWLGPLFMITVFISSAALMHFLHDFYSWIFISSLALTALSAIDFILKSAGSNIPFLRFVTHFLSMNLALLIGMFNYMRGVKSSIWQPTKRNQA